VEEYHLKLVLENHGKHSTRKSLGVPSAKIYLT